MTMSSPESNPMRPVPPEAHHDVPGASSQPGRGIFGDSYGANFLWGAVAGLVALLSAWFTWAAPVFLFGAPVAALVVGSLFAWRSRHQR